MQNLKKWLFRLGLLLMVPVILLIFANLYFFKYPIYITNKAYDSVPIGGDLFTLLDPKSDFINLKTKGSDRWVNIKNKSEECFSIDYDKRKGRAKLFSFYDNNLKIKPWFGELSQVRQVLPLYDEKFKTCNKVCVTFMPAYLYSGTFCFNYDEKLKIISKEKPHFWD